MTALDLDTGRGADLSPCGRYRYRLWRRWGDGAPLVWCMLNPSTADASEDDPTLRRVIGFTRAAGHRALVVVNLFAWRATKPRDLTAVDLDGDPVGPENDAAIEATVAGAAAVVAAWGADTRPFVPARAAAVLPMLHRVRRAGPVLCLGVTQGGAPRHPLYVRGAQPLVEYRP